MKIYKLFLRSHLPLETLGSDDTLSLVYIILRLPFPFLFMLVLYFLYLFFLLLNLSITQVCPWSFSVSSLIFITVHCILPLYPSNPNDQSGIISVNYGWKLISLFLLVAQSFSCSLSLIFLNLPVTSPCLLSSLSTVCHVHWFYHHIIFHPLLHGFIFAALFSFSLCH